MIIFIDLSFFNPYFSIYSLVLYYYLILNKFIGISTLKTPLNSTNLKMKNNCPRSLKSSNVLTNIFSYRTLLMREKKGIQKQFMVMMSMIWGLKSLMQLEIMQMAMSILSQHQKVVSEGSIIVLGLSVRF